MADQFGPEFIPLVAPAAGQAAGDRALTYILAFFTAVMKANVAAAWQATGIAPGVSVVNQSLPQNPYVLFNDAHVPALYMWRAGSDKEDERYADDYILTHDTLKLLWVLPWTPLETEVLRTTILQAVHKVLLSALERQRDPSWIIAGDPELSTSGIAQAQVLGSSLAYWAGYWSLTMKTWKAIPFTPAGGKGPHAALEITFEIVEQFQPDTAKFDPLSGLLTQIQTADTVPLITDLSWLK